MAQWVPSKSTDLPDMPSSLAGGAGKVTTVNAGGTAYELGIPSLPPAAVTLNYTGQAGKFLAVKSTENGVEALALTGGGTVTGTGTATRVAIWSGASVLTSNGGLYFDTTNGRLGVGTASPATTLHVLGIFRTGETSARSFELQTRDALTAFPVPCIRPATATTTIALDVMPNGNPAEYGDNGKAWLDVCDTDVQTGSPAVNTARVGIRASIGAEFGSRAYGTGATAIPLTFTIHHDTTVAIVGQFSTAGVFGVGSTAPSVSGSGACVHLTGDTIRIGTARTPASASATGSVGEICWDANYVYICVSANSWKRVAIAAW